MKRAFSVQKISSSKQKQQIVESFNKEKQTRDKIIKLGIFAMVILIQQSKKVSSTPMQKIIQNVKCRQIEVITMSQDQIVNKKVKVKIQQYVMAYCGLFPLKKAQKYVKLRKPFLINDLKKQEILFNRKQTYQLLKENNIPVARHFFAIRNQSQDLRKKHLKNYDEEDQEIKQLTNRKKSQNNFNQLQEKQQLDNISTQLIQQYLENLNKEALELAIEKKGKHKSQIVEQGSFKTNQDVQKFLKIKQQIQQFQNHIFINGFKLNKPFVQKPFDAQNHQINIYYPIKDGGGRKCLFRKVGNISSSFQKNNNDIRKQGNFIYQQFIQTNGFDIKVYSIGPYYMHAQARKAPVLDGVVQRDQDGKQKRYSVFLTPSQKFIGQRIVQVFGQNICGFDLLRSQNKTYVCDVNGFSLVKGNEKYYKDFGKIFKEIIFQKFLPQKCQMNTSYYYLKNIKKNIFRPSMMTQKNIQYELRTVVSIFRHAQRTPKQKMKMKFTNQKFITQYFKRDKKQVKIKNPKDLQSINQFVSKLIFNNQFEGFQSINKLLQLHSVLKIRGGKFEGQNRKIQLKAIQFQQVQKQNKKTLHINQGLLILKWGGQLTEKGIQQSIQLGKYFRKQMYPQDGLLRLHSTYRHDLKTYSSDQGRCQNTASAFLKGFLDLEGDLQPILNSMVNRGVKAQYCEKGQNHSQIKIYIKNKLSQIMNSQRQLSQDFKAGHYPKSIQQLIKSIGIPRKKLQMLYYYLKGLCDVIYNLEQMQQKTYYIKPVDINLNNNKEIAFGRQPLILVYKRYHKLQNDFYKQKQNIYDISKISSINDNLKQKNFIDMI